MQSEAFARYLAAFEQGSEKTLEQLAIAVLEDINNEVVPRWVQIVATRDSGGETEQHVLIEDRQPKWDNAALLARLERY